MSESEDRGFRFDRTDRATRLLVDGQNALSDKVDALGGELVQHREIIKTELAHYVSHRQLWMFLAALLGLGYWFRGEVKGMTDAIRTDNAAAREEERKRDTARDARQEWILEKIDGSSHFKADEPKRRERK